MTVDVFAALNGSGTQQVYVHCHAVAQDWTNNFTQYYGEVRYYGNGYGSYSGTTQYWSANFGGYAPSGTFGIPFAERNDTYKVLWAGYFNLYHDGNGNLGAFGVSASIDTDHSSIGDGTASGTEGAPARIPKSPSTPGTPTFSEVTPTSVRVSWSASTDNAGSAIDGYLLRRNTVSPADSAGYTDDFANNTSRVITGLTPGTVYKWLVYAHNGAAAPYSIKSGEGSQLQPAGVYVSDGTTWVPVGMYVSDGSTWVPLIPAVSTGSAWVNPV